MGKCGLCFKSGLCRLIGQFCCDTIGCKTQVALLCCDRSMSNVGDGDIITTILHLCYEYEFRIGIIYIYINLALRSKVTSPIWLLCLCLWH